jgi:ribonuclease HII
VLLKEIVNIKWFAMKITCGIDEVGRGSLAGPVVVCCVASYVNWSILDKNLPVTINDSKKLSIKKRESSDIWIRSNTKSIGIGVSTVEEIDEYGIVQATAMAAERAFIECGVFDPDLILLDAFEIDSIKKLSKAPQKAIVKGDSKEGVIAAASIVAKVYRDKLMDELSDKHPGYLWHKNKGYGTKEHLDAIKKLGTTNQHRKLFVRKIA